MNHTNQCCGAFTGIKILPQNQEHSECICECHTNKPQCCCKGKYPNLENHTPQDCWTTSEQGLTSSFKTNKPTSKKEVGESDKRSSRRTSSIPSPQEKKPFKESLRDLIEIQSAQDATDPYMVGMANGLICAWSVLTGEEPKYMSNEKTGQYATRSIPQEKKWGNHFFSPAELSNFTCQLCGELKSHAIHATQRSTTGDRECTCGMIATTKNVHRNDCPKFEDGPAPMGDKKCPECQFEQSHSQACSRYVPATVPQRSTPGDHIADISKMVFPAPHQETEEWEGEFAEFIPEEDGANLRDLFRGGDVWNYERAVDYVFPFIRNLISKERDENYREMNKQMAEQYKAGAEKGREEAVIGQIEIYARREADAIKVGAEAERNRIVKIAEGIKKSMKRDGEDLRVHDYNSALTDLIKRI